MKDGFRQRAGGGWEVELFEMRQQRMKGMDGGRGREGGRGEKRKKARS